ncbi:MAG: ArsR family transcriptional regulator [Anaerolineales bacterium]|nr:ArsR family transcriptional regulator [Anaerolineales bacterium]
MSIFIIFIVNIDIFNQSVLYSPRMSSTKDTILKTLRVQGKCTISELAESAQVSPVSVRHHLAGLQADGLVNVEEARHGVGRPHYLYSLTDKGMELFPMRYYRLTNRILEELKGTLPDETIQELFTGVATTMAESYSAQLEGLPMEERLIGLHELLREEGFETEIEQKDDQLLIHELSCPYFRIGKSHPEVCTIDQEFIANALSVPVERVTCLLDGDHHCTFAVQLEGEKENDG